MIAENIIWTEKFRPKRVEDVIGTAKQKIMPYLQDMKSMPHMLFYSLTPGCGKTSLAKAIINHFGCDSLFINSSDDRTLEVVREKVKLFAMTQSSKEGMRKIIMLDEVDGMTKISQEALRNIFETYAKNVLFILTCNNFSKVIDPIKSRCQIIQFNQPDKNDIAKYLKDICVAESMAFTDDGIMTLVKKLYPSIRNCVIYLQDLFVQNMPVIPENINTMNDIYELIYSHLLAKNIDELKKIIFEKEINIREFNLFLWNKGVAANNVKLIVATCKNEKDFNIGADEKVVLLTSLYELIPATRVV